MKHYRISERDLKAIMGDIVKGGEGGFDEPPFKVDKAKGEGKASKLELEYREALITKYNDLSSKILKAFKEEKDPVGFKKKSRTLVDTYIRETKLVVDNYIPKIWKDRQDYAIEKVEELISQTPQPKDNPEILVALVEWQKFNIERTGELVYLNSVNKSLGKDYFVKAYGR